MALGDLIAEHLQTNIKFKQEKAKTATTEQQAALQKELDSLQEDRAKHLDILAKDYEVNIRKEDSYFKRIPSSTEYYNKVSFVKRAEERDAYAYENSNLRAKKDDLSGIISKLLKAADVQASVDDLVGSSSLQTTVANQIQAKIEQASGHGEVLESYRKKTAELEQTLKELGELKNEVSGTRAEKNQAIRKIQEQEEKIRKQQEEQKETQTKHENVAQEMMKMQLENEMLREENKELKEEKHDFKDNGELGAGEHVQPHSDGEL